MVHPDIDLYVALRCNQMKTLCGVNECRNGGTCQVISEIRYTCTCAEGYTGQNCETDIGSLMQIHSHRKTAQNIIDMSQT